MSRLALAVLFALLTLSAAQAAPRPQANYAAANALLDDFIAAGARAVAAYQEMQDNFRQADAALVKQHWNAALGFHLAAARALQQLNRAMTGMDAVDDRLREALKRLTPAQYRRLKRQRLDQVNAAGRHNNTVFAQQVKYLQEQADLLANAPPENLA